MTAAERTSMDDLVRGVIWETVESCLDRLPGTLPRPSVEGPGEVENEIRGQDEWQNGPEG
jgi:hypothetical protein